MTCGNHSSNVLRANDSSRQEIIQYDNSLKYRLTFVQAFISLAGLLGNLLALIIINKKSMRNTSSAVFITYMAIFDSAVLLLHAGNLVWPERSFFLHCSSTVLTDYFTCCANWILVIITLERCVAVRSPFLAKRFCTAQSARNSVYILLTVSVIFLATTYYLFYDLSESLKRKQCIPCPENVKPLRIYEIVLYTTIPDLLLLSNIFTIYALVKRRREQQRTSLEQSCDRGSVEMRVSDVHSNRKQRQLTIMLLTVNFVFYAFTTPGMTIYFMELYPPSKPTDTNIAEWKRYFFFSGVCVPLLQVPNATNFIFYCLAGERFRKAAAATLLDFVAPLRVFYHRYIRGNKQYTLARTSQPSANSRLLTMTNHRIPLEERPKTVKNRTTTF